MSVPLINLDDKEVELEDFEECSSGDNEDSIIDDDAKSNEDVDKNDTSDEGDDSGEDIDDFCAQLGDQAFWAKTELRSMGDKALNEAKIRLNSYRKTLKNIKSKKSSMEANWKTISAMQKEIPASAEDANQRGKPKKEIPILEEEFEDDESDTDEKKQKKKEDDKLEKQLQAAAAESHIINQLYNDRIWFREKIPVTSALVKYLKKLEHNLKTRPEEFYNSVSSERQEEAPQKPSEKIPSDPPPNKNKRPIPQTSSKAFVQPTSPAKKMKKNAKEVDDIASPKKSSKSRETTPQKKSAKEKEVQKLPNPSNSRAKPPSPVKKTSPIKPTTTEKAHLQLVKDTPEIVKESLEINANNDQREQPGPSTTTNAPETELQNVEKPLTSKKPKSSLFNIDADGTNSLSQPVSFMDLLSDDEDDDEMYNYAFINKVEDGEMDPRVVAKLNEIDKEFEEIKQKHKEKLETQRSSVQEGGTIPSDAFFDVMNEIDFSFL